jgi:hypothetical protein
MSRYVFSPIMQTESLFYQMSELYVALFSRFTPCGAYEAVYIRDPFHKNKGDVQPDTVHADTRLAWWDEDTVSRGQVSSILFNGPGRAGGSTTRLRRGVPTTSLATTSPKS